MFSPKQEKSETILQHHEHQGNHQMHQGISHQFLLQTTKQNVTVHVPVFLQVLLGV